MDQLIKSKSQKKRDVEALQTLGVKLTKLNDNQLNQIPMPDILKHAIISARAIKSHGAKKRQSQLIGKLMRSVDCEPIISAYENLVAESKAKTVSFHEVERWRERLITEGNEALTEFIEIYHPEDIQSLRQLIKKSANDHVMNKNTGAAKALFRYLRICIQ